MSGLHMLRVIATRLFPFATRRRAVYESGVAWLRKRWAPVPNRVYSLREQAPELIREMPPFALHASPEPVVSIVIPTFDQALHLYNCLRSINRHPDVPFEVIVVDDCSTDTTIEMLGNIENVRVVRNRRNLGFVASVNAGIKEVRAPYVLLLNNDARLTSGALSTLVATIERNQRFGIVGARLLYPDGRLQEAGSIIWRDGRGFNYGRFDDPELHPYSFVREVDYCSAACLLIRRELLQRTNGLDERYTPAYYEDTDLAMQARVFGYSVLYQPDCRVFHYEGITHGTDEGAGLKAFQELNKAKFVQKWKDVLEQDHHPATTPPVVAARRLSGPRILVVDHRIPKPDRDSGSLRMFEILASFCRARYGVTFLPADLVPTEPYTSSLQQMGVEVLYPPVRLASYVRQVGAALDICLIARPRVARRFLPLIRRYAPATKVVYDTVDLHHLREFRRAEQATARSRRIRRDADRLKKVELNLVRQADATITVTDVERDALLQEVPNASIHVVPNIHEPTGRTAPWETRSGVVFVGSFEHLPNIAAVEYFVWEVLPILRRLLPGIRFHVVGDGSHVALSHLTGSDIIVEGWIQDLETYLQKRRVMVAPLTFGAGLKGKVGGAMSTGLPVVMTPIAAEGMAVVDGVHCLIANSATHFAEETKRLYEDQKLWEKLSTSGLDFVRSNYSRKVIQQRMEKMLTELIS